MCTTRPLPERRAEPPSAAALTPAYLLAGEVRAVEVQLDGPIAIQITRIRQRTQGGSTSATCTFASPFAVDLTPVLTEPDVVVVHVVAPRAEEAPAAAEAPTEEAAAAEPEVIKKGKAVEGDEAGEEKPEKSERGEKKDKK